MNEYLSKARAASISRTSRKINDFKKRKLKEKVKPEQYKHIEAWGQLNDELTYKINNQKHFASSSKAPLDTVEFDILEGFKYMEDLSPEDQKKVTELVATL
jgi:hypothetical protein